jgi:hypothetical protein
MKTTALVLALSLSPLFLNAQQSAARKAELSHPSDNSILVGESANLKSDLAQLRSMLNVLASEESGTDARSFAALQTNRQMWQVVIARLAELTQRIDSLEKHERLQGAHASSK